MCLLAITPLPRPYSASSLPFSLSLFILCFFLLPFSLSLFYLLLPSPSFQPHQPCNFWLFLLFSPSSGCVFFPPFLYLPNRSVNRDSLCGGTSLELCSPWSNKSLWYNSRSGNQRSESSLLTHNCTLTAKALLNTNCQSPTKWGKWNSWLSSSKKSYQFIFGFLKSDKRHP